MMPSRIDLTDASIRPMKLAVSLFGGRMGLRAAAKAVIAMTRKEDLQSVGSSVD